MESKKFIVYKEEILEDETIRRFYGIYESENQANFIAMVVNKHVLYFGRVCKADDAFKLNILNVPSWLVKKLKEEGVR